MRRNWRTAFLKGIHKESMSTLKAQVKLKDDENKFLKSQVKTLEMRVEDCEKPLKKEVKCLEFSLARAHWKLDKLSKKLDAPKRHKKKHSDSLSPEDSSSSSALAAVPLKCGVSFVKKNSTSH